jgi:DNA repair exonuclease SbcCD nuclease subunit
VTDCFVHASDLHLDAPLKNLGQLDNETVDFLRKQARSAWSNLIDLTVDRAASFLVLAGDLFDSAVAGHVARREFTDGLKRLGEEGIDVFIVHGNHDPLTDDLRRRIGRLPDRTHVFDPGDPQTHEVGLRSGGVAYVSGVSFSTRHEPENLAVRFQSLDRPTGGPHVAVLHANLGGDEDHDNYAPCSESDLAAAPVDYWALGHIHLRSEPRRLAGGGWVAYSGNPQGRTSKTSECQPKGALVVPIEDGVIGRPEFAPCDAVRFVHSRIELIDGAGVAETEAALEQAAKVAGHEAGGRPVVWFPHIVGRSPEPSTIREALDAFLSDENSLSGLLNRGGSANWTVDLQDAVSSDDLLAAGGLPAAVVTRLADGPAVQSTIQDITKELPGELVSGLLTADDERYEVDDLHDEIVRLTETLLTSKLGNRDG